MRVNLTSLRYGQKSNRRDIGDFGYAGEIAYHKVFKQTPMLFSEKSDQTEYGKPAP